MNPTPESTGRDVLAEIDEIASTMKTVLAAASDMGEEVIHYRQSWGEMAEKLTVAMDTLEVRFGKQGELSKTIGETVTRSINIAVALEERISTIERETLLPTANAITGLVDVIASLEERVIGTGKRPSPDPSMKNTF